MSNIEHSKPEHRPLTPRPGWTQEQEYIALSEEFFAVEENRDRLAEQLRGAVDLLVAAREWIDGAGKLKQSPPTATGLLAKIDACLTTNRGR
jgi:hypothetical protein